ncbi:hypothetical protein PF004_g5564 [Phytophthora fragariae]|nr:hypothetical protein PF004_g5564 [Phytophthora fragariae]
MRRQQQTSRSDQDSSPPVWKCEKCAGTVVVFNVPRPSSSSTKPPMKAKSEHSTNKQKSDSIVVATATSVPEVLSRTGEQNDAGSGWIQSVQPQWRENSAVVFDWYHFRSEKAEVLRSLENNTNSRRNGVDELVFYSKSYALMKKTAASWREYALKRQRFRRQQNVETKAMMYPSVKCDVMHMQTPTDKRTVIVESEDNWDEIEDEDVDLVDVTRHKTYSRRPPQLPLLWEGEPPSALMCWTTGERKEIYDVLDEMTEGICMMNEDNTAPSPRQEVIKNVITEIEQTVANCFDEEIQGNGNTTFGTYAAAVIIQKIFARHRLRRRRVDRAIRQRRAFEEATHSYEENNAFGSS